MKKAASLLCFAIVTIHVQAQPIPKAYSYFTKKADSLYEAKNYQQSGQVYSEAFKAFGGKGVITDFYNAACAWSLAGNADSAFIQLNKIVKAKYTNYTKVAADADFNMLHPDKRWAPLLETIKQNKEKAEAGLNKLLVAQLDSILTDDQKYRRQNNEISKKYGWNSKEMNDHIKTSLIKDSINLVKVSAILDRYGWLGPEVIGNEGNNTLFLVIQHANITAQEKYLPMMRDAVKNGRAASSSLALLEDRVALRQDKKQIYGTQVVRDNDTQLYYVLPLEDPDNVDKRRALVGLGPLAEYVIRWQIKWDPEKYKKDLPAIEAREKSKRK